MERIEEFIFTRCARCHVHRKFFKGQYAPDEQQALHRQWDLAKIASRFQAGIREDAIWLAQVRA
jgi:hypothetical protein